MELPVRMQKQDWIKTSHCVSGSNLLTAVSPFHGGTMGDAVRGYETLVYENAQSSHDLRAGS